LAHNAAELRKTGEWYRNFEYEAEGRERGLDFTEVPLNPLVMRFTCALREQASVIRFPAPRDVAKASETGRQKSRAAKDGRIYRWKTLRSESHSRRRAIHRCPGDQKTVIAGYPGLATGAATPWLPSPASPCPLDNSMSPAAFLRTFAKHVDQGMLPNRFPDAGETPEYNTVDATLGFSRRPAPTSHTPAIGNLCATNCTRVR